MTKLRNTLKKKKKKPCRSKHTIIIIIIIIKPNKYPSFFRFFIRSDASLQGNTAYLQKAVPSWEWKWMLCFKNSTRRRKANTVPIVQFCACKSYTETKVWIDLTCNSFRTSRRVVETEGWEVEYVHHVYMFLHRGRFSFETWATKRCFVLLRLA